MKRTAGEYAILLELLDKALDLPETARADWVDHLAEPYADLRPTLRRLLAAEAHYETSELKLPEQIAGMARDAASGVDSKPLAAGDHIGPYELSRQIGQGGMGSVWLASRADGAFKRSVALKLPHITWVGGLAERMARERDILAGLEHPYIARLYDAGVDSLGRPFMALEYVEGQSIDAYCVEHALTFRGRLALVLNVAKAVAYAHSKLVVHRDLKPGNILVTAQGDVRLLDFGIAKLIESDPGKDPRLTEFAGRLLTLDYASPEQIKGEAIGTATDVYSLAVVTYELLTGVRPYKLKRDTPAELEQAIADVDPLPASEAAHDKSRKRELRGDLDAILNKALKKKPVDRYPTVEAYAADLQRYLDDDPVVAQPDRTGYRLRKFVARNRLVFGAAAAVAVALVAATTFSMLQAREATRQAETATVIKNFLLNVIMAGDNSTAGSKPAAEMTALEMIDKGSAALDKSMATQPAVKLELLESIGDVYERVDALDKALAVYRSAVKLAEATYGPNSLKKADFLARIASALAFGGHYPEAETAVAAAESAFDAVGSRDSLPYAQLLKIKGNLLRMHGSNSMLAARETLQKAAAVFRRHYADSDGYVGTLMYLAGTQQSLDEMAEAKATADTAVLTAQTNAINVLEEANALSMRASIEDEIGDFAAAERDYLQSSARYANSAGTKDFLYIQNESFRGQSLHLSGNRDEGIRLLESTAAQIAVIRPGSNTLANCLNRLADAYLRDGAFDAARTSIENALDLPAAKHVLPLRTHLLLDQAKALTGLGRFHEAQAKVDEARTAISSNGPPSPYLTAEMHLTLGAVAMALGDLDESSRHLNLAGNASSGETRRVRHQRARIQSLTARLAAARSDLTTAADAASAARVLTDAADIRGDLFVRAEALTALGEVLCAAGASVEGLKAASEAVNTRTAIQRPGSPFIVESQIDLARCLLNAGQPEQAKPLLASAQQTIDNDRSIGPQFGAPLRAMKSRYYR